jgi:hypothetical protein
MNKAETGGSVLRASNGWSGGASAGREMRTKATESGSHTRNWRCFWEGLIWRKLELKIGIDTKKKTSKKLVINTVFLLVSNYIESGNFPFFNS